MNLADPIDAWMHHEVQRHLFFHDTRLLFSLFEQDSAKRVLKAKVIL